MVVILDGGLSCHIQFWKWTNKRLSQPNLMDQWYYLIKPHLHTHKLTEKQFEQLIVMQLQFIFELIFLLSVIETILDIWGLNEDHPKTFQIQFGLFWINGFWVHEEGFEEIFNIKISTIGINWLKDIFNRKIQKIIILNNSWSCNCTVNLSSIWL